MCEYRLEHMFQYFLEYHPNLHAVQVSLRLCCDWKYVRFCSASISTATDDDCVSWKSTAFPRIAANSLCNLKICPNNELSVRFQVGQKPKDLQLKRFVISEEESILCYSDQLINQQVKFVCRFCRCNFLEQRYSEVLYTCVQ